MNYIGYTLPQMRDYERISAYQGGPSRFTRRQVVQGLVAGLGLMATGGAWWWKNSSAPTRSQSATNQDCSIAFQGVDVIEEIRKFEPQIGNNLLTVHQAKNYYLPLLAEFFSRKITAPAIGSKRTAGEILANTFLIRRDFTNSQEAGEEFSRALSGSDVDVLSAPHVRLLALDYPNLQISPKVARGVTLRMGMGALGWVEEGKTFIVFDRANTTDTKLQVKHINGLEEEYPLQQFEGLNYKLRCVPPAPVVKIRSVLLHEWVHLDGDGSWQPLPQDMISSYQRVDNLERGPKNQVNYKSGQSTNFIGEFVLDSDSSRVETGFDEFNTDYLAAKMSISADLPYTLGYHGKNSPADFANFEVVLEASGITEAELYKLHRDHKLRQIMLQIAQGAIPGFDNEAAMLDFSTEHFLLWSSFPTFWQKLKPYFPGIDPTHYFYYVDPEKFHPTAPIPWNDPNLTVPGIELGCI